MTSSDISGWRKYAPFSYSLAVLASTLVLLGLTAESHAEYVPNDHPVLDVHPAPGAIVIDAKLDDPGWAGVAKATNFTQTYPGDNVQPQIGHEAWLTYDEENLYFAMRIEDDPDEVRASLRDRDEVWRDDYVGMIFDTYGTGAWAYELFINPLGVQMDLRWTPNGEDMGFDVVFESAGRITEDGWQVEAKIPFKSLRFPDTPVQEWHGTFWHNQPRESRNRYSWSKTDRDNPCWPCNWGTIRGIQNIDGSSGLELLPALTAFDVNALEDPGDPDSRFGNVDSDAQASLGLRYALNSSYAAEATLNPDFSQVESDAAQIEANTTFSLFYPERRPFFQEGSDLYDSDISAIYTRSINDPDWASKVTGRTERSSMAFLSAQDERSPIILPFEERSQILQGGRSWSNIFRAKRSLMDDSYVGVLGTDRRLQGGGSGTTFGPDTMLRFLGNYQFEGQFLFSHTDEPNDPLLSASIDSAAFGEGHTAALDGERYWGHATYLSLERHARHWGWDVDYRRTSKNFRADNGFVTQNDRQQTSFWTGYTWQPDNRWLDEYSTSVNVARVWNIDGVRKDEWIRPELDLSLKGQTSVSLAWLTSNERFHGVDLDGIQRWSANVETHFNEWVDGGVYYERGDIVSRRSDNTFLGKGTNLSLWANVQPISRLAIAPTVDFARLENPLTHVEAFDGYVARTRISLQFSRELFFRLVLQYDDFSGGRDIEPLVSYKVNPFTVFFVGSSYRLQSFGNDRGLFETDLEQARRQYFVKFQYLFRS
jgi:hypothetical protein